METFRTILDDFLYKFGHGVLWVMTGWVSRGKMNCIGGQLEASDGNRQATARDRSYIFGTVPDISNGA